MPKAFLKHWESVALALNIQDATILIGLNIRPSYLVRFMRNHLPIPDTLLRLLLALVSLFTAPASAHGQAYYPSMTGQTIEVPNRAFYVEQVLDGRPGKPAIGTIYKGLSDKSATVLFQQSLEIELTDWLKSHLPARSTDHAVILIVRQLHVGETVENTPMSSREISSAELSVDVYAHLPDGYHLVRNITGRTQNAGIGNNGGHAPRLAQLFQRSLAQLTATDWPDVARQPARTLAQVMASSLPSARPAVLRAALPRRGVYHNAAQFLANQPDTTAQLRLDTVRWNAARANLLDPNALGRYRGVFGQQGSYYSRSAWNSPSGWKGTVQLIATARTAAGERVAAREVWGFSDGRQSYLRQAGSFRALTHQGDFYTFVGAAPVDIAAAGGSWGRSGAANNPGRRPAPGTMRRDVNDTSGEPMVFALDMRTGLAAPFPLPGQPARADTAFLYVYRPLGGPPEAQTVLLNEREVGKLRPGECVELACPHYGDAVRLGLGIGSNAALLLVPNTAAANYVRLNSTAAASPWQWMPTHLGEAEVNALEKQRKP